VGLITWPTFFVFLVFLVALFLLTKKFPKFPGIIVLTPLGIILGYLATRHTLPFSLQTLESKFGAIPQAIWQIPHFYVSTNLIVPALTVAIVAILETMISAKIADGMTKTKHNKRKEMMGLGLANIASGLFGGLPATGVFARTALNVKTGANDKMSATIYTISVALISLILIPYFKYIPMSVIAAILVFTAIRMVGTQHFFRMFSIDKKSFFLSLIVAFVTVYQDPTTGILLGTAVALLIFMNKLSHGQFELIINNKDKKIAKTIITGEEIKLDELQHQLHTLVYSIEGQLAYVNAQSHISRFENNLNGYENVILRFRSLYFIDMDGVDAFEEIVEIIEKQGRKVLVSGINPLIEKMLVTSKHYQELKKSGRVFEKTEHALKSLGYGAANYHQPSQIVTEE
jgi:SulP family sulfate permease